MNNVADSWSAYNLIALESIKTFIIWIGFEWQFIHSYIKLISFYAGLHNTETSWFQIRLSEVIFC